VARVDLRCAAIRPLRRITLAMTNLLHNDDNPRRC
jgi:hypothetical protein